jgi:hypothetical protein
MHRCLQTLGDVRDPRFIGPVLDALAKLTTTILRTKGLGKRFQSLFGRHDLPRLRNVMASLVTHGRSEESLEVRSVIEGVTGEIEAPVVPLQQGEVPCSRCRWPSAYRCKLCKNTSCLLCYKVLSCARGGSCRWLDMASGDPIHVSALLDPGFAELVMLSNSWQLVTTVGVDSGMLAVTPLGSGQPYRYRCPDGDGSFPLLGRLGDGGSPELRLHFREVQEDLSITPGAPKIVVSRSGYFVVSDPIVAPKVDLSEAPKFMGAGMAYLLDGHLVIHSNSINVRSFSQKGRMVGLLMGIRS